MFNSKAIDIGLRAVPARRRRIMRTNQFLRVSLCLVLGLAILALGTTRAKADTIETYTGNPYTTFPAPSSGYTTANSITAMLTFANPLPANATLVDGAGGIGPPTATDPLNSLVLSDGAVTYTLANTINVWLVTGNTGQIISWFVGACAAPCGSNIAITTNSNLPPPFVTGVSFDGSSAGSFGTTLADNFNDPGVWTSKTAVTAPEPSSLLMGLLGIAVPAGKKLFRRE